MCRKKFEPGHSHGANAVTLVKIARMLKTERIFLTGMMGSGKSTLGPRVARSLSWSFVDLDDEIEAASGQTVAEFFDVQGEAAFRRRESEILREISIGSRVVVSLGGGTLLNETNQEFVLRSGTLVYLSLSEETLFKRLNSGISEKGQKRPLLAGSEERKPDIDNPRKKIRQLLSARLPGYQCAHLAVEMNGFSEKAALKRLLSSIASVMD